MQRPTCRYSLERIGRPVGYGFVHYFFIVEKKIDDLVVDKFELHPGRKPQVVRQVSTTKRDLHYGCVELCAACYRDLYNRVSYESFNMIYNNCDLMAGNGVQTLSITAIVLGALMIPVFGWLLFACGLIAFYKQHLVQRQLIHVGTRCKHSDAKGDPRL